MHLHHFGADGVSLSVIGLRVHGEQRAAQTFCSNPRFLLISEAWMAVDPPHLSLWQTDVAQKSTGPHCFQLSALRLRLRGETGTLLIS